MKIIGTLFLFFLAFQCYAQISIIAPPFIEKEIYIGDVSKIMIINHQRTPIQGYVIMTIIKNGTNESLIVTSDILNFQSGSNRLNINQNLKSIDFSSNIYAGFSQSIKGLPYSDYRICYKVIGIIEKEILAEECENFKSMPLIPVTNESPGNNASVEECGFMLIWSPPVPMQNNITYTLKIVENSDLYDQGNLYALANSNPKILRNGIQSNSFFVASNMGLIGGRNYIWQVSALQNGQIVSQSKPSSFTYLCGKEPDEQIIPPIGTYWGINNSIGNSKYYLSENILRIKYDHYSTDQKVKLVINKVDVSPLITIFDGLLDVKYGVNLIEQPLETIEEGVYRAIIKDYAGNKYVFEYIVQK